MGGIFKGNPLVSSAVGGNLTNFMRFFGVKTPEERLFALSKKFYENGAPKRACEKDSKQFISLTVKALKRELGSESFGRLYSLRTGHVEETGFSFVNISPTPKEVFRVQVKYGGGVELWSDSSRSFVDPSTPSQLAADIKVLFGEIRHSLSTPSKPAKA